MTGGEGTDNCQLLPTRREEGVAPPCGPDTQEIRWRKLESKFTTVKVSLRQSVWGSGTKDPVFPLETPRADLRHSNEEKGH